MFLHLGGDAVVPSKNIVAILDMKTAAAPPTKEFMQMAGHVYEVINIAGPGREKSFVITTDRKMIISPISCTTLHRRARSRTLVIEE
ncbi:extracellular matrix regulator RemB [Desulfurispora thermophila]|uniref:extracellular matrix regulator RemB n=1 Tax=Desulfurispora thermophila TaxID=265470 RepID=UPI0003749015|nr:extracellular matrix/biofilm biosynthesis regulator RemA family protein [Desulfurispora thermophila]